ncbi:Oxoglutarate/iron-dependent dioxygenase [Quillaja saponaria]|uniref:Oxoglutarate/iron-dependent dioxygenase n=1 Tax=Quillaja saponaria TaxID=32244 RepID=A0AAD7PK54_QUISA|nr:Oxoglutarate/iron-dependent dioxygenase [Quillaja saponaria]
MSTKVPLFSEKNSLSKSLQDLSINGDEPRPQYIVKESKFGSKDTSALSIPIPIIDVSLLSYSKDELEKLRSSLSSEDTFRVREAAKHFFTLPAEDKQEYARAVNDSEGYGMTG